MMRRSLFIVLLLATTVIIGSCKITNSSSDASITAIAAIEKVRGAGFVSYMIHEHLVPGGEVAFFIRNMPNDQIDINAEYVKKTSKGWNWGYGGGFGATNVRMGLSNTEARKETFRVEYFPSTAGSSFGSSPFPMFYGVVLNPDITRMTVKDYLTGLEKQAEIIEVERNFKLFYTFVDQAQGTKFDVIGYAADGTVIHKETTDESHSFQGSTTKDE